MKVYDPVVLPSSLTLNAPVGPPTRAVLIHHAIHRSSYPPRTLFHRETQSHHVACHYLWRNVTVIFGTEQQPKPNLISFDSERLAGVRSLSIIVDEYFNFCPSSFTSVLASINNIGHVRVSGGSAPFICLILKNPMASLVTLELHRCDAKSQDIADMVPVAIRDLRFS